MSSEIIIPDIGGASDVDVIEVMVSVGDVIKVDDSLVTLESDKASMEIPSPQSGTVLDVSLRVGDKVSEGSLILLLDESEQKDESEKQDLKQPMPAAISATAQEQTLSVFVPDIGDATEVDVIEVMVKVGDAVDKEGSLITLEGDKATMEIPSPFAGIVESMSIQVGDKVSQGDLIMTLHGQHAAEAPVAKPLVAEDVQPPFEKKERDTLKKQDNQRLISDGKAYAGPAVRRFARELGVALDKVVGTGRKGRITKTDVQTHVKARLSDTRQSSGGFELPKATPIDFSKFGEVEVQALNKIKRLTGANMHRSWLTVPHVTQFDEADVSDLESFRKSQNKAAEKEGYKLTVLAFVVKAVAFAMKKFPHFNASLDETGDNLILKKYINVGIAVDTPNGLVVPVIKNCNNKSLADIARDMAKLSKKAREKGLMPADMRGGCFTISSLGGIGGTAFTPIVNHPEVAILGLSRNQMKPVFKDGEFVPRMMLPLALSYDHRVIDGAEAARFTCFLSQCLSDIRTLLL